MASLPPNRYLLGDDLKMQQNVRFSAGVSRTVTRMLSVNANYAHTTGANLMRGLNLNAPVNGVRPDPRFVNVVQVTGDAESTSNTSTSAPTINFNVPPRTGAAGGGPATGGPIMLGGGGMIMIRAARRRPATARDRA